MERPLENGWLADTPIDDTILRKFVHNQAAFNSALAAARGGRSATTEDVFLADTGSSVPFFNQAILARPLRDADDDVLDEVESFYAERPMPRSLLSIWPSPDLHARGWTLAGHPAVVVRGPAPHALEMPDGVEVRVADDAAALAEAERVLIEGYPIDEARGQPPNSELPTALIGSPIVVRLGSLGGEPVAVGMVFVAHGLVNLCGGATLPAARRKGVWEALVWSRVLDAPDLPAIAYTSDYSRPGFIRMDFMPITRFTLWVKE